MTAQMYPMPEGCRPTPKHLLDLRPDSEIDHDLLHPKPVTDEKNAWFYWHTGYATMHPYLKRAVQNWHRRFSKQGWIIRVIDRAPDSPLNIANFLDINDPKLFPKAFTNGALTGTYAIQHNSDLVRWPLLLKYGGVYADVGMIQIGDLDILWNQTIANPNSPYDVVSYNCGGVGDRGLSNYFFATAKNNPLFERSHRLLIELWAADGGKDHTEGMSKSPLVKGAPFAAGDSFSFEEDGKVYGPDEVKEMLSDYIIQGLAMTMVMGLVDKEDGWNGPEYCAKHVYAIDYMVGSQLINEMTAWNGPKQFHLMSLQMPKEDKMESEEQKEARGIVEACLSRSFGFKLAHGLIIRVLGDTLGSLWKKNPGADNVPGTYADWLRYGTLYWTPEVISPRMDFQVIEPYKVGPLLREN
ncbi:Glycosyltransferase afumC [Cladobotryum mycophilum]|uniref:Glycosyltransferase afumC n=1 Tax=Cladobotryum mycophilum TaxID=491253 RepID=A0ABR0S978_9HYPO